MNHRHLLLVIFLCLGFLASARTYASAESSPAGDSARNAPKLRVAVFERPPYTFKNKEGVWTGLSIELWEEIAGRMGMPYEYVEVPLSEIFQKLHAGGCDLAPGVTLSGENAKLVEFTEPYLFSHGAVVLPHQSPLKALSSFYAQFWNTQMLAIFLSMFAGMILFSVLLLLFERKHTEGHFGGTTLKGFGSALWFSAVTMTTVGYGDKTPLSATGRIITFFWMLAGVLIVAFFTGSVASTITTAEMRNGVSRLDDLSRFRNGVFEGSRMDFLLRSRGIPARRFTNPGEGFITLSKGEITAFAGESVALEYMMTRIAPGKFQISLIPDAAMIYGFACRPGLSILPDINTNLLEITLAPDWRQRMERWTGPLSF